jgi:hypothetical protein
LFAEDSVAECGDALGRSDAGAPLRQHVRASTVAAAARWVAGPRPRTDGWRSGASGALGVVVGKVACPEELVRVTSLC